MSISQIKKDIQDLESASKSSFATPEMRDKFEKKIAELKAELSKMSSSASTEKPMPKPKTLKKPEPTDFYSAVSKKKTKVIKMKPVDSDEVVDMKSKSKGKVMLKSITIHWAEGDNSNYPKFPQTYDSWSEANDRAVKPVYADIKKSDGGYNKVKFTVNWEDGEEYEGRLDVCEKTDNPTETHNVIGKHIWDYLNFLLRTPENKGGSPESMKKEIRDHLANYDLGRELSKSTKTAIPNNPPKITDTKITEKTPLEKPKSIKPVSTSAPERKKSVPLAKKDQSDFDYDCDELIEKEKKRRAKAKERAKLPKKSPLTKNKEKIDRVVEDIEERSEKGDLSKEELMQLISKCKQLLKNLESTLSKMK